MDLRMRVRIFGLDTLDGPYGGSMSRQDRRKIIEIAPHLLGDMYMNGIEEQRTAFEQAARSGSRGVHPILLKGMQIPGRGPQAPWENPLAIGMEDRTAREARREVMSLATRLKLKPIHPSQKPPELPTENTR
jgi:hypothetical protein